MLIANRLIRKRERGAEAPFDSLTLDSAGRYRRRIRAICDGGGEVLIDLPEASFMRHGDVLEVECGLIEVRAAPEPLLEIVANDAQGLSRVAWHLGNRHTAAELTDGAIYIQPDHVLEHMVEGLGAMVKHISRAFEPEAGAYDRGHDHGD